MTTVVQLTVAHHAHLSRWIPTCRDAACVEFVSDSPESGSWSYLAQNTRYKLIRESTRRSSINSQLAVGFRCVTSWQTTTIICSQAY